MPNVFVYGALMYSTIGHDDAEAAFLPDHKVAFVLKGVRFIEPSFAALIPAKGETAWGIVNSYPEKTWNKMKRHEIKYIEKEVVVTKRNGGTMCCIALIANSSLLPENTVPSARYAKKLHLSAEHYQFPDEVVNYYHELSTQGNRFTSRMRFISPIMRRLIPKFGQRLSLILLVTVVVLIISAVLFLIDQIS